MKTYKSKKKKVHAFKWKGLIFGNGIRKLVDVNIPKDAICELCNHKMCEHGEIVSYGKYIPVCPGDYIVIQDKELVVMSKKQFKSTFKEI